ncbi:ABC transporter ATP-binding protein [Cytobacillus sp. IB215665]|uniref:ABC transporter ATP-binding protein n=1 Tax=Cytobacillus sp. IB215665 TaxID=3097357 RepID=UPI002A12C7B5|nr:ABC transporter ATP-binding protein [Cytobacillus sp. IB215665]MDX8365387.1 ABC transporter ATP-binding protein [Cytobacillus sp. IB215665]
MNQNYFKMSFLFIFKHAKYWVFISLIFAIITGLIPIIIVWLSKEIINFISSVLQGNSDIYSTQLWFLLSFQLAIFILQKSVVNIQLYINTRYEKKLDYILEKMVSEKSVNSPLAFFENAKFHNHLERIQYNKGIRLMSPVLSTLNIFQGIITLTSLFIFLFTYHWLLIVIVLVIVIPIIYIRIKYGKKEFLMHLYQTPNAREQSYLAALLTNRVSASEIRLFNLKDFFLNRWSYLFKKINREYLALIKSREFANISTNVLSSVLYFIVSIFLLRFVRNKSIQIGDFVSILQSVQAAERSLTDISYNIGQIYSETLYIRDLFEFLDFEDTNYIQPEVKEKKPFSFQSCIEFRNVSFKYPYSEQQALKNVSFKIAYGDKIAIVGQNGSGKTTLIYCLMGLYPINQGEILIDGVNIQEIDATDLYKNITVIFQDYMKYNLSLKQNIVLDSLEDTQKLTAVTSISNVNKISEKLKDGDETVLGKIFLEGEDLSEGQWQKIAIARALYKEGEIFILDEPTSALDPKAEIEVYNQFDNLTKRKTGIFISHRMASARLADKIFVMQDGEIIEVGSHEDLMNLDREYAQMYQMQLDWYK